MRKKWKNTNYNDFKLPKQKIFIFDALKLERKRWQKLINKLSFGYFYKKIERIDSATLSIYKKESKTKFRLKESKIKFKLEEYI